MCCRQQGGKGAASRGLSDLGSQQQQARSHVRAAGAGGEVLGRARNGHGVEALCASPSPPSALAAAGRRGLWSVDTAQTTGSRSYRGYRPILLLLLTPRRSSCRGLVRGPETSVGPALRGDGWVRVHIASLLVPAPAGALVPELRTARENARLEIGSQRGRNSHQIGVLGIYDLQGLSYGRTELLVADMRLLAPDPSGSPPAGRCQ